MRRPVRISGSPFHRSSIGAAAACALLLITFAALSLSAAGSKSATYDEVVPLVGGWTIAERGDDRLEVEEPPLFKRWAVLGLAAGSLRPDYASPGWTRTWDEVGPTKRFAQRTLFDPQVDGPAVVRAARRRMIAFGVALGAILACWAAELGGPVAAVVAAALFCLDPTLLGHAPLVKNDVPLALGAFGTAYAVWRLGRRLTPGAAVGATVCATIAMTSKFSAPLWVLSAGGLLFGRVLLAVPWKVGRPKTCRRASTRQSDESPAPASARRRILTTRPRRLLAAAVVVAAVALGVTAGVWLAYGCRAGVSPDLSVDLPLARYLPPPGEPRPPGLRAVALADRWGLLPRAFNAGLVKTYATTRARVSYLAGRTRSSGSHWYFPAAVALKAPLSTLAALAASAAYAAWRCGAALRRGRRRDRAVWAVACAGLPAAVYAVAAVASDVNLGLRHLIPDFPFAFLAAGWAAAGTVRRWPRRAGGVLVLLGVGLAIETLGAYPDFIAFFNAAAGGERGGIGWLGDSNLDWGQDLPLLAEWQRTRPADEPLYLCYFGLADPRAYGVRYLRAYGSEAPGPGHAPGTHGWLAISATNLQGIYLSPEARGLYAPFRPGEADAVLGGTIYLFRLDGRVR